MLEELHSCSRLRDQKQLTVTWLRASTALMTILIAVAALNLGHVLGLRALPGCVTFLIAVTAHDLSGLGTIARRMSFLAAIEASSRAATTASLRAVSGVMAICDDQISPFHSSHNTL